MRKGKSVIGQDVYSLADGVRIDTVKDVLVDEANQGVIGLLVDQGGLLGTSKIVPISAVRRFGPKAVMIDDSSSVIAASSDPIVNETLDRRGVWQGARVVSEDGDRLGSLADLYFDEATKRVLGYEVSGGVVGDAMHGTSYLPVDHIKVLGPDAVIATTDAAQVLESQKGGLTAAVDSARSNLGIEDGAAEVDDDPASRDPDGQLVGKRAKADLFDGDGSIVVANGQRVTLELVQRARSEDNLDPLYQVVGEERPRNKGEEAVKEVTATASDLWGRFTTRLSELTDTAGQKADEAQTKARLNKINDAIGRPVTKVFLDRDDTVILDLGDLITHQAVQRAADAGQLDTLLECVYKPSEVTFSRDEMRAEVEGDSTVDKASGGAGIVTDLEGKLSQPPDQKEAAQEAEGQQTEGEQPTDQAEGREQPVAAQASDQGGNDDQQSVPQGPSDSTDSSSRSSGTSGTGPSTGSAFGSSPESSTGSGFGSDPESMTGSYAGSAGTTDASDLAEQDPEYVPSGGQTIGQRPDQLEDTARS